MFELSLYHQSYHGIMNISEDRTGDKENERRQYATKTMDNTSKGMKGALTSKPFCSGVCMDLLEMKCELTNTARKVTRLWVDTPKDGNLELRGYVS